MPIHFASHPLEIKPNGNAYAAKSSLRIHTGYFFPLTDELIVQILEELGAEDLLSLGSTCRALFAFSRFEELWKTLFIEYCYSPSVTI